MRLDKEFDQSATYLVKTSQSKSMTTNNCTVGLHKVGYTYKFMTNLHLNVNRNLQGTVIKECNGVTLGVIHLLKPEDINSYEAHEKTKISERIYKYEKYSPSAKNVITFRNKPLFIKIETNQLDFIQTELINNLKRGKTHLKDINNFFSPFTVETYIASGCEEQFTKILIEVTIKGLITRYNKIVENLIDYIDVTTLNKDFDLVTQNDTHFILHYGDETKYLPKSIVRENNDAQVIFDSQYDNIDAWYDKNIKEIIVQAEDDKFVESHKEKFDKYSGLTKLTNVYNKINHANIFHEDLKEIIKTGKELIEFNNMLLENGWIEDIFIEPTAKTAIKKESLVQLTELIDKKYDNINKTKDVLYDKLRTLNEVSL